MKDLDLVYALLVEKTLQAPQRPTRNGTTRSHFGVHFEIDMSDDLFPVLLGRKMFINGILGEMAAFLKGPKRVSDFKKEGCNYWDAWGDDTGLIEVDYGNSWLDFNGVNQLQEVVNSLKDDPAGRRHLITGWRPDRLSKLSLPCCHYAYQWYVNNDDRLDMIWNQRSVDLMVGLPSDFVLAAIFNILMAFTCGYKVGKLHLMLGDVHIYENHLEGAYEYLRRVDLLHHNSREFNYPMWGMNAAATVFNFEALDFNLFGYEPQPAIKFTLEV